MQKSKKLLWNVLPVSVIRIDIFVKLHILYFLKICQEKKIWDKILRWKDLTLRQGTKVILLGLL